MSSYYDTAYIVDRFQVSKVTVCRKASKGLLPGVKVGKEWRFPKTLIDAMERDALSSRDRVFC